MTKRTKQVKMPVHSNDNNLSAQMDRMKKEGYKVFPATMFAGDAVTLGELNGVMNFSALSLSHSSNEKGGMYGGSSIVGMPGGFTSSGTEEKVESVGSQDKGFIRWGSNNFLPNFIALANSSLVYTAVANKFNIDTSCGIGMRRMYRYFSNAGGATNEEKIPFDAAGSMIRSRIVSLQNKIFQLTRDYTNQPPVEENGNDSVNSSLPESSKEPVIIDAYYEPHPSTDVAEEPEKPSQKRNADGTYFKRIADDILDDMVKQYRAEIAILKKDYANWQSTQKKVKRFFSHTNTTALHQRLFTDLCTYGICFPEIDLSQNGSKDDNSQWKPDIVGISHRDALTCRLEKHDENCVSRFVYISNQWLNPQDKLNEADASIDALPAIDPMHPCDDLMDSLRKFRLASENDRDISKRQCRRILPIKYHTAGKCYYPTPAYWTVFNDIYQFASNIIRDRAIRKQNENMFGRVVYVHSEYLDRLVMQTNAAKTDDEKKAIKQAEILKIKNFLSNKFNNGQTFSACTFFGQDGKDHDAFRVETIPYNTKNAAEADKTEISDISSILMFAMECHPDLIGSTPGGSASKGGTYQREMMMLKQAKMATTQNLIIEMYNFIRDFNDWDEHLCFEIAQKSLTTLDVSKTGEIEE